MFCTELTVLFFFEFLTKNLSQIKSKARLFSLEVEEIKNELFILIADRIDEFDPAIGNAEAFFFGLLHARLARYRRDVAALAQSIDDESKNGVAFRAQVEYLTATRNDEPCFTNTDKYKLPGASDLESLADAASGQSASEIAQSLGVTRRRVNQIRHAKEVEARTQMGFDFGNGSALGEE